MSLPDICCGRCFFFEQSEAFENVGFCHRYAPRPTAYEEFKPLPLASWPQVDKIDGWCGECQLDEHAQKKSTAP